MITKREDVRNIAIIAHVDHGKTTLVDELLKQSGTFRENQEVAERVMDSNDIERERGITILSKNTAVYYKDTKINIIDTPGHADFGGEVERVLKMVNGVILVVDAYEGVMPQTKFVLHKALDLDLDLIVCVNKIDRPEARPDEVVDEVLELLLDLDANDKQLECPFIFASAREGFAKYKLEDESDNMIPLFETIINHIPAPEGDAEAPLQLLISTIDYNEYVGRIGVGKIDNGTIKVNQEVLLVNHHDESKHQRVKVTKLYEFNGLNKVEVNEAKMGSIVAVSGITDLHIGDTLCNVDSPAPIPFQKISEPTIAMNFMVNDSPLAGQEGKFVTSRHLRDRLFRELNTDVSLRVEETDDMNCFKVSGRGELHLSVLIENMRREGYEFQVSRPHAILKEINGVTCEPYEEVVIDAPQDTIGSVIELLGNRKGIMQHMENTTEAQARIIYEIPSRGLIGFNTDFMTVTKGYGIMSHSFIDYRPMESMSVAKRPFGVLVSMAQGQSTAYALGQLEDRGQMFIEPGEDIYEGMIVGQTGRDMDMAVNVVKAKQQTNTRSSNKDMTVVLKRPIIMTQEQCLEFINDDELVEVTPNHIRLRKKILDTVERKKYDAHQKEENN